MHLCPKFLLYTEDIWDSTVWKQTNRHDQIMSLHKLKTHRGLAKNVMHCLESGLYHFVLDYRLPDTSAAFFLINKY